MDQLRIYVYAICKNEASFVPRWVDSMQEADGIYVLDTGSTDDTVALLQARGVHVRQHTLQPWRFDVARNLSLAMVPMDADICVCTDLDEVFHPGWRAHVAAAWQEADQLTYRYTWNFLPDGSEGVVFHADKMHARRGFTWVHPVHEVLRCTQGTPRRRHAPGVQLDHHADAGKSRAQYLPLLELSVREDPTDDRNMHYLGREYLFHGRHREAIATLQRHLALPKATWADERSASWRYMAQCHLALGEAQQAEQALLHAVAEAPHLREGWLDLAHLAYARAQWPALCALCLRALQIETPTYTYLTQAENWGALPYDLLALAYYHMGMPQQACDAARQALAQNPGDARLQRNLALLEAACEA